MNWKALPGWLGLLAGLGGLLLVVVTDPFGDRGMSHVMGTGLALVASTGLLWLFVTRSAIPIRVRLGGFLGLFLGLALVLTLVRVDGVNGEMVPNLRWRWSAADELPTAAAPRAEAVLLGPPSEGDYPGFLGPRRDNAVLGVQLERDWGSHPPRRLWRQAIGAGWSAFACAGGWAFTLEQDAEAQRASARRITGGELMWSVVIDEPFEHILGGAGPRATPMVELEAQGGRVIVQSAWGRLVCLDAASGARLWEHDLLAEHGSTREAEIATAVYGRSGSPLVVGELVIVPAGGDPDGGRAGLVAFEKRSGERRWSSPPRHFSYSSPTVATLAGVEQVLIVNEGSVSGHGLDDGRLYWEHPWPGETNAGPNVSQAVPCGDDRVLVSKGYGGGGLLLALRPTGDGRLESSEVWRDSRLLRTKLTNVVLHEGFFYGLDDGMLECVAVDSGEKRWKSGRYGHGQVLLVRDLLLLCSEEGEVFLIEATPARENVVLGSFQGLEGKSWAHLALAGNVLLLRNETECSAWELPVR